MPQRKMKTGTKYKPQKMTRERVTPLLTALRMGLSYERACQVAGITTKTLNYWRRRAEDSGAHPDYKEFAEKFEKASAAAELYHASNIYDQAEDDWRASMFYLKARHPHDWGERAIIEFPWEEHFREMGMDPQEVMHEFLEFMHLKAAEKQEAEAEADDTEEEQEEEQ